MVTKNIWEQPQMTYMKLFSKEPKQVVLIGSLQMFNSSKSHHPDEKLKDDHRIVMYFYTCERM